MTELRVGVVGLGSMGKRHAEAYRRLPGVRLTAIATRDAGKRATARTAWGVAAFADYRELVGHVDAVTVATPTYLHAEVAEYLMQAGVHVLVEKPIAITEQEALRLQEAAEAADVILMVGHVERFNPAFLRLVAEPKLIRSTDPLRVRACRMGPYDGRITDVCVVMDLMIHDFDLALALSGANRWTVRQAIGMSVLTKRTDVAMVECQLLGETGRPVKAVFMASRVTDEKRRVLEVSSGSFTARADLLEQRVWVQDGGGEWSELSIDRQPPLELQLAHFAASARSGTRPVVDGEVGTTALRISLDTVQAIRQLD